MTATAVRGNDETLFFPELYSARFIFSGNVFSKKIFWMMQLGFGEQEKYFDPTPLVDSWIDFRFHPAAYVRIGTLDKHAPRHSSANNVLTMDSLAHYEFDLFRDVGVRVYSDKGFGSDKVKYWFDLASGKGLTYLERPEVPTVLLYGRVEVSPLGPFDSNRLGDLTRRAEPALSIAASAAYNYKTLYQMSDWLVPGQTAYHDPFNYVHASGDVHFKWRGFALLGTALYRRATTRSHDGAEPGTTEYSRNGWGWFAVASMMLDDHIEVASRVGAIYQLDRPAGMAATAPYLPVGFVQTDLANFRDLREAAAGASYYFAGHAFKVQADYARIFVGNFREGIHEIRAVLSAQL